MEVGINASMCDDATLKLASALHPIFRKLGNRLGGDYGGVMEHLWIDFELIDLRANSDGKPRYPFRLQKRVSGRSRFGLPPVPDQFNVGHFSVRPDLALLPSLSEAQVVPYALALIYEASSVLLEKQKKLGGFDAVRFRAKIHEECGKLGYSFPAQEGS